MRQTITVRELEGFVSLAEHLNFNLAAEHLHVSQPALTRMVQSAESKLNARLFDRNTRRVDLTASGKELLPIARRILTEFHGSLSDLSEFVAGRRGNISIACLPSVAAAVLPPVISRLQGTHPLVTVTLDPTSAQLMPDMVRDGSVDFAITTPADDEATTSFESLLHEPFVLICSRNDVVARNAATPKEALLKRPLISSGASSSIRQIVDRELAGTGHPIRPKYTVANISVLGAMVSAGLGVSLVPLMALRLMDMTQIHSVPIEPDGLVREIGVLTRKGRSLSSASIHFIASIRAEVDSLRARGALP
ncbi:LysR family transcriptional regulator [Bordetella genomosp. 12]|uniref:HTH lysR-type domain-containing protein n=1 Tax=Bordetella genomosp. 12 TaxID=463035 RepID=A0A261V9W7_9BORD|nr:LysR family transcriptional regulator [Bordetella genomosp. 12]OZI70954.1 hypothetical protein CAL22_13730 [Bordetella genomosp. 12]